MVASRLGPAGVASFGFRRGLDRVVTILAVPSVRVENSPQALKPEIDTLRARTQEP